MEHFRCTWRIATWRIATWRIATWRIARSARAMQDYNGDARFHRPGRPMRHRPHREPSHCHARHRAGIWGDSGIYAPCIHIYLLYMCDIRRYRGVCAVSHRTYPSGLAAPAMPPHSNRFTGKGGKTRCIGVVLMCLCTLERGCCEVSPGDAPLPSSFAHIQARSRDGARPIMGYHTSSGAAPRAQKSGARVIAYPGPTHVCASSRLRSRR